jgi:hypothetical protein
MAYTPLYRPPELPRISIPAPPPGVTIPGSFAPSEATLRDRLAKLPSLYSPRRASLRAQLMQSLAGIGGYRFGVDDPSTPEDESLNVDFDPNAPLGPRQRQAVMNARSDANARGMLYSSFADEAIGAGLGEIQRQAQAALGQYQSGLFDTFAAESNEFQDLVTSLGNLYGDAARYLQENPPPPPPEPPAPAPAPAPAAPSTGPNVGIPVHDPMLGPWSSRPNLDPKKFFVFTIGNKWYARRR